MRKVLQEKILKESKDSLAKICLYGSEISSNLETVSSVFAGKTKRLKKEFETLKVTANYLGVTSLSSNQIGSSYANFIVAKNPREDIWLIQNSDREIKYNTFTNLEIYSTAEVSAL